MSRILELQPIHLEQVQYLVNGHLRAVVPGWALPLEYIAFCLKRNPSEYVTDPWVWERKSLVALKEGRVCGAAHLLKYGADSPASGSGEIDWFVCWPNETATGAALLSAAEEQLGAWECRKSRFNGNLPAPLMSGVPDSWPHVIELISEAGYAPRDDRDEAVFGGTLNSVSPPGEAPVRGMRIKRTAGGFGTCFTAWLDDTAVCTCECGTDLDQGGRLPAFSRWAGLSELGTEEDWRNKGIGAWVVRHAVQWLVMAGKTRCVLCVAMDNEKNGAGRFYRRFGWSPFVRLKRGWTRTVSS